MISTPAILDLDGKKIVPVRAIPFVSGNLSALDVAKLLADPELNLFAYVLGSGIAVSDMVPKEWEPIYSELRSLEDSDPRATRREQIASLPASTFVYWERLWRTYENHFMPDRDDLDGYSVGELANFQLQKNVNLPADLVELVFEGFIPAPVVALTPSIDVLNEVKNTTEPIVEEPIPWHLMAEPAKLIDAFGKFTSMNQSWFKKLSDKPALLAARGRPGKKGRGGFSPQFHVYPVMLWLIDPKRKAGKPMGTETGWRIMKNKFPKAYEEFQDSAPDTN